MNKLPYESVTTVLWDDVMRALIYACVPCEHEIRCVEQTRAEGGLYLCMRQCFSSWSLIWFAMWDRCWGLSDCKPSQWKHLCVSPASEYICAFIAEDFSHFIFSLFAPEIFASFPFVSFTSAAFGDCGYQPFWPFGFMIERAMAIFNVMFALSVDIETSAERLRQLKGNYQFFTFKCIYRSWRVFPHVKSSIKPFVAPEEAACYLIYYLKWCHSVVTRHCG